MAKRIGLVAIALCIAFTGVTYAAGHYKLGSDWKVGEYGVYVIAKESDTNRVLCTASVNDGDPKHAWVNKNFGENYTIKCDVQILSWADASDPSRAGIGGHIQPNGTAADGDHDRGVNILFHNDLNTVQFLNDLAGWGPSTVFTWALRTSYTMEITFAGDNVTGSITNKAKPTDKIDLASWAFVTPANRRGGFAGVTASTAPGQVVYFDNFQVIVDGQVAFSDDFEGTAEAPSTVGVSNKWVAGTAGYYVVNGGQLYAIATDGADPKHMWFNKDMVGGAGISADVTMLSWDTPTTHDHSRAGLATNIQPNGTNEGTGDRGICLLFHQELTQVQFLNDNRAWGDKQTMEWKVGTKYAFKMSSDNAVVKGSIGTFALPDWTYPDPQNRLDGFAGVTASTRAGQIAAIDNVKITDAAGNVVFTDDFATFWGTSDAADWELYQ